MKAFDELTDAEVLALNEEQVQFYIDRECAEAGIPLVPPDAPTPPEKQAPAPDVTAYKVTDTGILLTDMQEAERLRDLLNSLKTRGKDGYSWPSYRSYFKPHDTTELAAIEPVRIHSEARAAQVKHELDAHAAASEEYKKASAEYDKNINRREEVAKSIYARRREVSRADRRRQELLREFDRYLPLADGNRTVAARFLGRAHGDASELLPDLFVGLDVEPAPELAAVAVPDDDIAF